MKAQVWIDTMGYMRKRNTSMMVDRVLRFELDAYIQVVSASKESE